MEEEKEASPPSGSGSHSNSRGVNPTRPLQRNNRAIYNTWATQRRQAPMNNSVPDSNVASPPENNQGLQRGNRRALVHDLQSPELFSPPSNGPASSNSSSESGLNGIRQLLEDIDSSIPGISDPSFDNETFQGCRTSQAEPDNSRPSVNHSSGQGVRNRPRRRLQFNGRGAAHSSRNIDNNSSLTAAAHSQNSTSPSRQNRPNASTSTSSRARRNNVPPLRFGRSHNLGELSSDSSDDLSITESHLAPRPVIRPLHIGRNPFLQGLGTEEEPYELSPDLPDAPSSPSALMFGPDGFAGGLHMSGGNGNNDSSSTRRRRGGGGRGRFSNSRPRGAGGSGNADNNSSSPPTGGSGPGNLSSRGGDRGGAAVLSPTTTTTLLPPPGTLSDEELARRLQEEEWEAASVRGGDDDDDANMAMILRSMDSPLHLFGGYHRRRPRANLPPLPGREEGNSGTGTSADSASRPEESSPFFYDGPTGRQRGRSLRGGGGRGRQRHLAPLDQYMFLTELRELAQDASLMFDLFNSRGAPFEIESMLNLGVDGGADGNDYEALLALAERIGDVSKGLSQSEINKLPTRKHRSTSTSEEWSSAGATGGASVPSEHLQCNICLSEYENGDQKRLLPCKHDFHKDCVDTWLKTNATCPVCRSDVKPKRS